MWQTGREKFYGPWEGIADSTRTFLAAIDCRGYSRLCLGGFVAGPGPCQLRILDSLNNVLATLTAAPGPLGSVIVPVPSQLLFVDAMGTVAATETAVSFNILLRNE